MVKGAWFIVHGVHWLNSDLGQAGTVIYLAHPLFPPPLPQAQSGEVMVIKVMMINGMVIRVMVIKVMGIKAMVIKVMVVMVIVIKVIRPVRVYLHHQHVTCSSVSPQLGLGGTEVISIQPSVH